MTRRLLRVGLLGVLLVAVAVTATPPREAGAYAICVGCVGWDGPGLGSANLQYYFGPLTQDNGLTAPQVKTAVVGALNTWSQYAAITWTEVFSPNLPWTLEFGWSTGKYGPWNAPFPASALAISYYPPPNNWEPLAGNIYFNDAWTWSVDGSAFDIFSVALHEIGHALGLAHSPDPTVVMNDTYRTVTGLTSDDIAGIRSLYAPGPWTPGGIGGGGESDAQTVPEPGTLLLLLGSALAGLAARARRIFSA